MEIKSTDKELTSRILTTRVSSINKIKSDQIWQITRAGPDVKGAIRIYALAPSSTLFSQYCKEWKGRDPKEWWHLYKARYMEELKSTEAEKAIQKLVTTVSSGTTVALVCFCADFRYCHRSIVAEVLRNRGISVEEYLDQEEIEHLPKLEQMTLF